MICDLYWITNSKLEDPWIFNLFLWCTLITNLLKILNLLDPLVLGQISRLPQLLLNSTIVYVLFYLFLRRHSRVFRYLHHLFF